MQTIRLLFFWIILLISPAAPYGSVCADVATDTERLTSIHKIYIGVIQDEDDRVEMATLLKRELENSGFVLVDDPRVADAILKISVEWELNGAGDAYSVERYIYSCALVLINGKTVWKAKVKIGAQSLPDVAMEYRAQKIVARLLSDRKKAARKDRMRADTPSNNSLDRSGGSVFRIKPGAPKVA